MKPRLKARLVVPSAIAGVGLIAAVTVVTVTRTTPTSARAEPTKSITFAGYEAQVPASWPVYDLRADPKRCVRFDQHAVYLGTPSPDQNCPAHAVGRTEALLVEPLTASAPNTTDTGALRKNLPEAEVTVTASYLDDQSLAAAFVETDTKTRTWRPVPARPTTTATTSTSPSGSESSTTPGGGTPSSPDTTAPSGEPSTSTDPSPAPSDPAEPTGTPSSSDTPTPSEEPTASSTPTDEPTATPSEQPTATDEPSVTPSDSPGESTPPTETATPDPTPTPEPTESGDAPSPSPSLSPSPSPSVSLTTRPGPRIIARPEPGAAYPVPTALLTTGTGFDTCEAPSITALTAWAPTNLDAVGIYVGGANRACGNVNLTADWVRQAHGLGYTFLPTYVGLQAPCNPRNLAKIDPKQAAAQGAAAADDAVARMRLLGLGTGNPIYLDMENYTPDAACTTAVMTFTTGFVRRAHALRYTAGFYSNASSGIQDLAANATSTSVTLPDAVWIARWNKTLDVDAKPYAPDNLWVERRTKQYDGDHNESHGGVTINIDSDFLVGVTARPGNY